MCSHLVHPTISSPMSDSPAKRAPATGTRVVRSKKGEMKSPIHRMDSNDSSSSFTSQDKKAKRRPFTTPCRIPEVKRDPTTPTRTVRPKYRPNTGGLERPLTHSHSAGTGMMTVVHDSAMPVGVMSPLEICEDIVEEPIEWVEEEPSQRNLQPAAVPQQQQQQLQQQPQPTIQSKQPPHQPIAAYTQPIPSPKPKKPPAALLDVGIPPASQIPFGKEGSKVRTGSKTLIGRGSFGCVFRGLHEGTNQIVAIKEIHLTGESAGKVAMIKKEIQLMKKLKHPNIVRYLGAERVKTQLHIYLEYVTGGSMASLVKEYGPLTEGMTRKYSRQVLEGLHYLHVNNIVHRDIKCDNLLVGTDGTVKLADFGTSKELRTLAATVTGTACFMAPEVIKGVGHGLASDVWSLGCTVIEMLHGKPPFTNFANQWATMMYIASLKCTASEIPPHVTKSPRDFLRKCLQVDPAHRATAEQLLRMDWYADFPEDILLASPKEPAPIPISSPVSDSPMLSDAAIDTPVVPPALQTRNSPIGLSNVNGGPHSHDRVASQSAADDFLSVSDSLSDEETSNFNPMLSYVGDN